MIDKKKTYLEPITTILAVDPMTLICTSTVASGEATLSTEGFEDERDFEAGEVEW